MLRDTVVITVLIGVVIDWVSTEGRRPWCLWSVERNSEALAYIG